ncbi:MAG: aminotransferase class I/II-fold pyridoxal phosphate-dependent enzyme [Pseudomonadota bacterium]
MTKLADRLERIKPFYVMDVLAKAKEMQQQGRNIIHLEVGEPDFPTPEIIKNAGIKAIKDSELFYTPSLGIFELRKAIADFYQQRFSVPVNPENVVITTGASAALFMLLACLLNPDDELMLCDPGYPCNFNFAHFLSARINRVKVNQHSLYQLTAASVQQHWTATTRTVLIASPSNPTGTLISLIELKKIYNFVKQQGATLIVDEIYQGLVYELEAQTAASISSDIIIINSFSKYFQMTGWRLGWCIVPDSLLSSIDKLSQNLYLAPPTSPQWAAIAAFEKESIKILEQRREIFKQRRDFLYQQLLALGFKIPVKPSGAFYLYADCSQFTDDSKQFCYDVLQHTGVAITPGADFGNNNAEKYVRFAYTQDIQILAEAVTRIKKYIDLI